LPGPSAILMAIMASGFGGQRFSFRGYLPADTAGRIRALRELEVASARDGSTQVFIETPYRNDALIDSAARTLGDDTLLCAATGLSTPDESVVVMKAAAWRSSTRKPGKTPTVFLVLARAKSAAPARVTADQGSGRRKSQQGGRRRGA
ncbi:MAG: hypothetical protein JXM71_06120, partial [Spirochaetales bacterium]|nr:hypothetical protein [Spirochaetales bacterium]